ncbi:MAG: hypothetical protein ACLFOY_04145 [Desulfatibacillaceae bacterium]
MRRFLYAALAVLLVAPGLCAAGDGDRREGMVDTMLEISRTRPQVKTLCEGLPLEIVKQFRETESAADLDRMVVEEARKAYDVDLVMGDVRKVCLEMYDEKTLGDVLAWLRSDMGKKVSELENPGHSMEESQRLLDEYAARLGENPLSDGRVELVKRLDEAARMTENVVDLVIFNSVQTLDASKYWMNDEAAAVIDMTIQGVESMRGLLVARNREVTRLGIAHTYRELSDEEFQKYVEFTESTAGKRHNEIGFEAIREALGNAGERFGHAFSVEWKRVSNPESTGEI